MDILTFFNVSPYQVPPNYFTAYLLLFIKTGLFMEYRIEHDTLGEIKVPADKYWGAQTERSRNNFKIGSASSMPFEVIYAYGTLKKAAAIVNYKHNLISEKKKDLIVKVAEEIAKGQLDEHFPLVIWQTGSGTQTNMNVNEVIANRAHVLMGEKPGQGQRLLHPNDDVNKSQSSNDTFPTAMHMAAYNLLTENTIPSLELLLEELTQKSIEFKEIVKTGRTHMMDAVPLSLGQEFSGYASQIDHGIRALNNTIPHLLELAIGGTAVGTSLNAPEGYDKEMVKQISALMGYSFQVAENKFEALASHDALVSAHGALKTLAVSLMKIANDIRILSSGPRGGIGELILPANEPGSSIMPGKVNPTQTEAVSMVSAQIIGNDVAINVGGSNGHLELNTFKPLIISNFLESARLLGDVSRSFSKNSIKGIKPNREKIKKHLNNSLMIVTALSKHIGYKKSAEIAQKAYKENKILRNAAIETGFVTAKQFDEWVDLSEMTGSENNS